MRHFENSYYKQCEISKDYFLLSKYEPTDRITNVPSHGIVVNFTWIILSQVNDFANIGENSLVLFKPVVHCCHACDVVYERNVSDFLSELGYTHVNATADYWVWMQKQLVA